jgi:cytochrome c biogenesis protein CcdA
VDALIVAGLVALLLGLRHATDPDHLTAVATLILSERHRGRAGALGLAWGAGHAATLLALGLPIVLATPLLPEGAHALAEVAVGVVIAALSLRLLLRWRRGYFHAHVHEHDGVRHAHPHVHERAPAGAAHPSPHGHGHAAERSVGGSFALGLLHGVGGSAGAGLVVIAASPAAGARVLALVVFAAGTALSMGAVSWVLGRVVARGPAQRLTALVPAVGLAGFAFGVLYGLHAAGAAPGLSRILG